MNFVEITPSITVKHSASFIITMKILIPLQTEKTSHHQQNAILQEKSRLGKDSFHVLSLINNSCLDHLVSIVVYLYLHIMYRSKTLISTYTQLQMRLSIKS